MINILKSFVSYAVKKCVTAYEHFKVYLGYATKETNEEGTEEFIIDGERIPTDDIEVLNERGEEIASTVMNVCSVVFLVIMSCFIVNEFFFLILLVIEIGSVYWLLKYGLSVLFKEDEEVVND